ncbi:FAD-binding oxidoreductase [Candidatus Poribacteria bacterium]
MSLYSDISGIVGEANVSKSEIDKLVYSRDLASSIPDELLKAYGLLGADLVVLARSVEHVSEVLAYAHRKRVPVVPRAAGTWALGGVLPLDGGIALDMNNMNSILELNEEDEYVRVEPGIEWKRLIDYLDARGYQVGANPSSGLSATVGGYIATGGTAGIGVTKYGTVGDQIISLKVALADGRIIETNPLDSWLFVGSEGTLGVTCEATLKIFRKESVRYLMFAFDSLDEGTEALGQLYDLKPYFIAFLEDGLVRLLNRMGGHMKEKPLTVALAIDGTEQELELMEGKIQEICAGAYRYPDEEAEHEWESRYKTGLSFKRLGPSLFAQEMRIPVKFLGNAMKELGELLKDYEWGAESLAGDNNTVVLSILVLADERIKSQYMRQFSFVLPISKIAYRNHGTVFGMGMHNAAHMSSIHGFGLDVMRYIKESIDPGNIINPSKTLEAVFPKPVLTMFMIMMRFVPQVVSVMLGAMSYLPVRWIKFGMGLLRLRVD